ncbi:type VI secretion system tip protein TssI/VgrG [Rhodanobacter sp. AS-Z3]|uniref:type VI secretion system Vgr family protein n=1 Tax=Rhodanobacter sp. AS-Z3 TaxID=3031330 RepID=UPI0024795E64|nr:type VI secretion system tip protein TssI/VgrG [Rhodanobacter sp. AS-Z3]WEN14482.1 type VI secretion system tip protein TssI/VgrG [Rhodanobacter sp. AS-Z3]
MAHQITISSAHDSELLFVRMSAAEHLGKLFSYQVQLLSKDVDVDLRKLLGKPMTVKMELVTGYKRYFNGIVSEASQTGFQSIENVRHAVYTVSLVPKPWLLSHKVDCRIYKDMSVPDIIKAVLGDFGYADVKTSLTATYAKREYCVQYREDCFNFISRLMEQEGIYYYFTHTASAHTMVLADALGAHSAVSPFETLPYCPPTQRGKRHEATVSEWSQQRSVHSLKFQLTDYDPLKPKASLLATESANGGGEYHELTGLDVFDYPGLHVLAADGQHYARVRVEAANVPHMQYAGSSDAEGLATGALFKLKDFPSEALNQEYLVVGSLIHLEESDYASGDGSAAPFRCSFQAIESRQPYRSMPSAIKPNVVGLQTAVVTGSDTDEDIAVDKHGRVQVTFHWNKTDKKNALSSCFVRVASPWAGKGWGAVSIPRIGQEVVVSFLEGDPDRPLIIGSVYNADNTPPYALPDNKTQSGIKSRSLLGAADDANELRFEDKKGSEQFFIHAQKDMLEEVENDHTVTIDHDEKVTIKNDQTVEIKNNQTETIDNDRKITVKNDDTLDVTGNATSKIGKSFKLSAGTEIELVTGASSIVMKNDGTIEIKGVNIKITGSAGVKVEGQVEVGIKAGATMDIGAGASLKIHSDGMAELAGAAMTTVKAPMLMLKGSGMVQMSGALIMIG